MELGAGVFIIFCLSCLNGLLQLRAMALSTGHVEFNKFLGLLKADIQRLLTICI